jgi:hypothetical protein
VAKWRDGEIEIKKTEIDRETEIEIAIEIEIMTEIKIEIGTEK